MDRIRALLFDHRRPLAAAFAALAVLTAVQASRPAEDGAPVLVAAHDLDSGHVLTGADLTTVDVPEAARPEHVLDRSEAAGRRVAGPLRAGEAITDRRVVEPRDLSGHGADAVLSMVRLDDPAVLAGLRVGDRVDVVARVDDGSAAVVAADATVAVLPPADERSGAQATVGVVTPRAAALDLAAAAIDTPLAVIVTS
jgi:Flp pilus assembly protein CpaB